MARTYCTTSLTLQHRLLLIIPQLSRIQTTTVSSLQLVIGESHGAQMNIALSVNQVSSHAQFCAFMF